LDFTITQLHHIAVGDFWIDQWNELWNFDSGNHGCRRGQCEHSPLWPASCSTVGTNGSQRDGGKPTIVGLIYGAKQQRLTNHHL
jgi:hypothetical protein